MRRRKVLIVPFFRDGNCKTKCVVVQDSSSGDWTFISGTCEPNERFNACMKRELAEETLHCVQIEKLPKSTKNISVRIETPKRNVHVRVYFIPLRRNSRILKGFYEFAEICKEKDMPSCENSDIAFLTYKQILRRHLWDYIRDDIMQNPLFIDTVRILRIM